MKTIDSETIKKIWKYKLTRNFNEKKEFFSVYLDSPFCASPGCKFCCFGSNIIKNKEDIKIKEDYYNSILINNIREFKDILLTRTPYTVYFGGGSSSLMSIRQMKSIFNELQRYFDFKSGVKEKTFELNPSQITEEKLELLSEWNFTHATIGVQTFDKKVLEFNNRKNPSLKKVKDIFKLFEKFKFEYNMDLVAFIYKKNVDEDLEIIKKDLEIATTILKPNRITIFPNYFQLLDLKDPLNPRDQLKSKKVVFEKIKRLRKTIKKFNNRQYSLYPILKEVNLSNYRGNYYLKKRNSFTEIIYNCSGWYDPTCRPKHQNVLAFGGYGTRKPFSYINDKFCYNTINKRNARMFELVFADVAY